MAIDTRYFTHPSDQKALSALQSIPGFTPLLKGFLKILAENTFCGTVSFEGGIPATSKTYEVGYHGYGVRSIRATAEKYGGNAIMKTEDGWFQVHVLIPQQET